MAHIDFSYDTRNSNGLKVYASDEERTTRCCGNCGNREYRGQSLSVCLIDGHRVGYLDCDFCWCRHWKRNRKFDHIIKA